MRGFVITTLLVLAASGASAWQSSSSSPTLGELAERAKKEREARRAGKPAPKVITDADLKSQSSGSLPVETADVAEAAAPAAPQAAAAGAEREKTDDELRAEKRQEIEKKIAEQRKTADVVRKAMDDAQSELNDPTTATMLGTRGEALRKVLDEGQVELKKSEQAIADLREEARRQGIAVQP
jgi:hypothetical protein